MEPLRESLSIRSGRSGIGRASLPYKYRDSDIAARLYDEVFEEYQLCDDIGLNIVSKEHHGGFDKNVRQAIFRG